MKPVLALRHVPHETLGTLEDALAAAGLSCQYVDQFRLDAPTSFDPAAWSALVVLGGPMNVDEVEKYPFLAREVTWLRQAIDARLPVLGICLGSQLLAKALGSAVRANTLKEIGWYDVQLTHAAADDPLLTGCPRELPVFQWHGDTFDLPAGSTLLATSLACRHQMFRYDDFAYGMQFHWEVSQAMVREWLEEPCGCAEISALDYINAERIAADLSDKWPAMRAAATPVLERFAQLCAQKSQ